MTAFAVIALCLLAGLALARARVLPEKSAETLNGYVIWVALPALIIANAPQLSLNADALIPMAFAWGAVLTSAVLVWLLAQFFRWSKQTRCVLLLLVPLGNTSFVGIPLVSALLGKEAVSYAILYDQLGSFLALASYGALVIALHSENSFSIKSVLVKLITFPPFIALIVAFVVSGLNVSSQLLLPFDAIGATLVPVVMVAVGLQWQFRLPKEDVSAMTFGLGIKLILMPALVWMILKSLTIEPLMLKAIVLESAMAPMISAAALAINQGQNPKLAGAMVGYGLLMVFLTVPLWLWLIQSV